MSLPLLPHSICAHLYPRAYARRPRLQIDLCITSRVDDAAGRAEAERVLRAVLEFATRFASAEHSGHCEDCGCEIYCECGLPCVRCALAAEAGLEKSAQ